MQKVGDYWLPDRDTAPGKHLEKAKKAFADGGEGSQIHHLHQALYFVPEREVVLDVGANIGSWTRVLAGLFATVHAFEPVPETFECLQRNIRDWGLEDRVRLHAEAISDRAAGVAMSIRPGFRSVGAQVGGEGSIPAITLDSLELSACSFIKLDVEGHEVAALEGARETIARLRPWVMIENKPGENRKLGRRVTADKVIEAMGYRLVKRIGDRGIDWLYCPAEQYTWALRWKKLLQPWRSGSQ